MNPVSGGPVGKTEDEQSVASYVTFGKLRILYLGDFTWNQEFDLMCPSNRIGTVDLFVASRHGQPSSNSEALVHALQPRVTIVNNGSRKGGQPAAMNILLNSPRLENLWQIHFALLGGQEYAVPGTFIANLEETPTVPIAPLPAPQRGAPAPPVPQHEGMAYWIKGVGPDRWPLHGHQQPERLQQDLQPALRSASQNVVRTLRTAVSGRPARHLFCNALLRSALVQNRSSHAP